MKQHMTFLSKILLITLIVFVFIPTGVFADSDTLEQINTGNDVNQQQNIENDVVTDDVYQSISDNSSIVTTIDPELKAQLTEKDNTVLGELIEKRTANSKQFLMSDGSFKQVLSIDPQHYVDSNGKWQDIDTQIIDEADIDLSNARVSKDVVNSSHVDSIKQRAKSLDRHQTSYRALQVPFDAVLPKDYSKGYSIGKGSNELNLIPVGATTSIGFLSGKNQIKYTNVWNNTDVKLEIQPAGIKESLVLKDPAAPTIFSFEVRGSQMLSDNLSLGELHIIPAWLEDANGVKKGINQILRRDGDKVFLDLQADVEGLAYPITIDPTVVTQDATFSGFYAANQLELINGPLQLDNTTALNLGVVKYDISSIPANAVITQSVLRLTLMSPPLNYTSTVSAYPAIVTNYNRYSFDQSKLLSSVTVSPTSQVYDKFDFNVLTAVNNWKSGQENTGIVLSSSWDRMNFYDAQEATSNQYKPKLIITYNLPPTGAPKVLYPNGGEILDTTHTITWNASVDPDTVQSQLQYQVDLSRDNGATWSTIVALTNPGVTSYSYNFSAIQATTTAIIRVRSYDGNSYSAWDQSDSTFTIKHNQIPNAPTGLTPGSTTSSTPVIVIGAPVLNWTFSDPDTGDTQSAYQIQIYNGSTLVKDSNWVTSSLTSYTVPTSTLTRNTAYNWKVRTKDNSGAISNYSSVYYIKPNALPTATITSYTDGQQLADNVLTFTWTYADANSQAQTNYQILGSQDNWATTVYNSGILNGTATSFTTPALANGTWSFKILVKDGLEWSNAALRSNLVLPNAFEPNDTNAQSFQINYSQSYNSLINSSTDVDFYKFTATSNEIDRFILNVPSGLNYDVYFYDSAMKLITAGVQAAGTSENELFEVKAGNTYYIKIVGVGGNYSTSLAYNFILAPATQQFQTTYTYDSNGNILTKTTTSS